MDIKYILLKRFSVDKKKKGGFLRFLFYRIIYLNKKK